MLYLKLKSKLNKFIEKYNSLNIRKRFFLFSVFFTIITVLWLAIFIVPFKIKNSKYNKKQIYRLEKKIRIIKNQIKILTEKVKNKKLELSSLSKGNINYLIQNHIIPDRVNNTLKEMVINARGLNLIEFTTKPARIPSGIDKNGNIMMMYDVNIKFEGDFLNTLHYLERLPKLKWYVFYDHMNYIVKNYPIAIITINMHTLSMQKSIHSVRRFKQGNRAKN